MGLSKLGVFLLLLISVQFHPFLALLEEQNLAPKSDPKGLPMQVKLGDNKQDIVAVIRPGGFGGGRAGGGIGGGGGGVRSGGGGGGSRGGGKSRGDGYSGSSGGGMTGVGGIIGAGGGGMNHRRHSNDIGATHHCVPYGYLLFAYIALLILLKINV